MRMTASFPADPKQNALREEGALNSRPGEVIDPLFLEHTFFDARDLVQVKYEMLRRVRLKELTITEAALVFGFSRVALYQIQKRYLEAGIAGLLPKPRGPQSAHKLSEDVMVFLEEVLSDDSSLSPPALAKKVKNRFGISVHPRSIERAFAKRKKKRRR